MGFPDRIERTMEVAHPPAVVWAALTTAEGLGTWFGNDATIAHAARSARTDRACAGRPAGRTPSSCRACGSIGRVPAGS